MRRILIIDDEDDIREIASLSLQTIAGWHVSSAAGGAEGIRAALNQPPDAILLDVMMPAMDGPTTFRELQRSPTLAHVPVILLTATAQCSDPAWYGKLGVHAVLCKPFDPLTLASQISSSLGWI